MPTWNAGSGEWTDGANWNGGVPNGVSASAGFSFSHLGGSAIVGLLETNQVSVGVLQAQITGAGNFYIQGSAVDTGTGTAVLRFDNGNDSAFVQVINPLATGEFGILGTGGLRIELATATVFDIVDSGGRARITAAISGAGVFSKAGAGLLILDAINTMTSNIFVSGGELWARSDAALGSGSITLTNNGLFRSAGTVDNVIGTPTFIVGAAANGRIASEAGLALTLTGELFHRSSGRLAFGDGTADSEVIAAFSGLNTGSTGPQSFQIDGGIFRMGSASIASFLFDGSDAGYVTEIVHGAFLDTRGHNTTINNLVFIDGSRIISTVGALNVSINSINFGAATAHNGSVLGTASIDRFVVTTDASFTFSGITFNSWSVNDVIQLLGNSAANVLTGSVQDDEIFGDGGDDTINGEGGLDFISAGDGSDRIVLVTNNSGSGVFGGAGVDTLELTGPVDMRGGTLDSLEAITFTNGSSGLELRSDQFNNAFAGNSTIAGSGAIVIYMEPGFNSVISRTWTIAPGSGVVFNVSGSAGNDLYKGHANARHAVDGGDGLDRINGGDDYDILRGGNGIDKLRGDGGGDDLYGGAGADVFKYRSISDSTPGLGADFIYDFVAGEDRLNLSRIDSNPVLAGDQSFDFIGTAAFSGASTAQIRYRDTGSRLIVEVDVDGDTLIDMQIELLGATGQVLTGADFVL